MTGSTSAHHGFHLSRRKPPKTSIRVTREDLLRTIPYLRNLFRLHDLDVAGYSDEAIADAILQVCPIVTESWPTEAQLRAIVRHLRNV